MVSLAAVIAVFLHFMAVIMAWTDFDRARIGALVIASGALAVALFGVCVRCSSRSDVTAFRRAFQLALWLAAFDLAGLVLVLAALQALLNRSMLLAILIAMIALPIVVSYGRLSLVAPRFRFPAALALGIVLGAWMIRAQSEPYIDVWYLQQQACGVLIRGENPYTAQYPNIYPDAGQYGRGVLKDNLIQSFCYPPLSLLLALPGYCLAGDVRWSLLAAISGTAVLLVAMGRRMALPPGHWSELGPIILLFHPITPAMYMCGWTEPFVALGVALCGWAIAAGRGWILGVGLAAVATVKQYGFLWIAPVWATGRLVRRHCAMGVVAAVAILLPFAVGNPRMFWLGTVTHHLVSPFKPGSLSIPAVTWLVTGYRLSPIWDFAATAAVTFGIARLRPLPLSRATLAGGSVFLTFFLFSKAGNVNYHWLVMVLFIMAIIGAAGEMRDARVDVSHQSAGAASRTG